MEVRPPVREALLRIQIEYIEMPQLKLTARQVQRLWNLSEEVCENALTLLTGHGFLLRASDGKDVRPRLSHLTLDGIEPLVRAS